MILVWLIFWLVSNQPPITHGWLLSLIVSIVLL